MSCEKETLIPTENSELNSQKDEIQTFKSTMEVMESGLDIESYVNSLHRQSNKDIKQSLSKEAEGIVFITNSEDFPCSGLPTEDFEEGRGDIVGFPEPLDEFSNNDGFQPGEILPGVNISSSGDFDPSQALAFFDAFSAGSNTSKVIFANYFDEFLVIDFTTSVATI